MMRIRHVMTLVLSAIVAVAGIGAGPQQAEYAKHQGTWSVLSFRRDGNETPQEITRSIVRVVNGDSVIWKRAGKSFASTRVELDPSKSPPTIDIIPDGGPSRDKRILGIYKFDGERLIICVADPDRPRPIDFKAEKGSKWTLMTFERKKPVAR